MLPELHRTVKKFVFPNFRVILSLQENGPSILAKSHLTHWWYIKVFERKLCAVGANTFWRCYTWAYTCYLRSNDRHEPNCHLRWDAVPMLFNVPQHYSTSLLPVIFLLVLWNCWVIIWVTRASHKSGFADLYLRASLLVAVFRRALF